MPYVARFVEGSERYQHLREHIRNVAEIAATLGKRNRIENLCRLAGLLHDLGKYSDEFQTYIKQSRYASLNQLKNAAKTVDHGVYGAKYLRCLANRSAVQLNSIMNFLHDILAMCICYHHGGLEDYVSLDLKIPLLDRQNRVRETQMQAVENCFFADCISRDEFDEVVTEACKELREVLHRWSAMRATDNHMLLVWRFFLIKLIYSCLIDADRLDAYNFVAEDQIRVESTIVPYIEMYRKTFYRRLAAFADDTQSKSNPSAAKIMELRQSVSDECGKAADRDTGIYTLTVPTGGGKTLASLRFALDHLHFHQGKSTEKTTLIYVLPYTTILEQNANEIRKYTGCAQDDLLEHHSAVVFSPEAEDDERKYKLLTERWNCPIIFMTQVQFLNALYASGTQGMRRLHALANSVIIIDEVQTIPLHCIYFANGAFNALAQDWNSTIVLCTATQPNLGALNIPAQLSAESELVVDVDFKFKEFERVSIVDACMSQSYSLRDVVNFSIDIARCNKSLLIIMNTKKSVKELYDLLASENTHHELFYLTTYLCAAHRRKIIDKLKEYLQLGKDIIVISTNLIECGVDLSFDAVIRNISGLPSIQQSSGRANRHGEKSNALTYIINYEEPLRSMQFLKMGQQCTKELLKDFHDAPASFDKSLLSRKAVDTYFRKYMSLRSIESQFGFPVKVPGLNSKVDLFRLISEDQPELIRHAKDRGLSVSTPIKFVGKRFRVIDDATYSVLVPYNDDANRMIGLLLSIETDMQGKKHALGLLQKYVVNVFDFDLKNLLAQDKLMQIRDFEKMYALKQGNYSNTFGILETGLMTVDICGG